MPATEVVPVFEADGRIKQIWHAHIHRKVFIENVAHRRVDIGDKPIGIAAAFIGFRPGEALLLNRSLGCYRRHRLSQ